MEIIPQILLLIFGFVLLIKGADFFVDGSSSVAKLLGIPSVIIGLTIVAIGTSLTEFVIITASAIKGSSGIALGNIIGSNIFNGMFILGVTALLCPIKFNAKMLTREIPFNLLASIVLLLVSGSMLVGGAPGEMITRYGGMILLCFLAVFVRYTFSITNESEADEAGEQLSVSKIVMYIIAGLAALIFCKMRKNYERTSRKRTPGNFAKHSIRND